MGILIPLIDQADGDPPTWLQTEKARVTRSENELCTFLGCDALSQLVRYAINNASDNISSSIRREQNRMIINTLQESGKTPDQINTFMTYVSQLTDLSDSFNVDLRDFAAYKNWGIFNNEAVIIDVGFTDEVSKLYFR